MNDERCDRDRVMAILTLAEKAKYATMPAVADFPFVAQRETPWLARRLLEALDTIDRLEAEKEALVRELYIETGIWRGPGLNGGNESGDDR